MTVQMIQTHLVQAFDRVRRPDEAHVDVLIESIKEVGLLNPITVVPATISYSGFPKEGFDLIAGAHRLEAYRKMDIDEIPAIVVDMDEQRRVIAECDENLCGPNLSPAEVAAFTKRRKFAYEMLHPETRHGAIGNGRKKKSGQLGHSTQVERFTADTAAKTGQSERKVRRDAERGEKITDDAISKVTRTKLDTGKYLDTLKNVPADEQETKVMSDLNKPKPKKAKGYREGNKSKLSVGFEPLELEIITSRAKQHGVSAAEVVRGIVGQGLDVGLLDILFPEKEAQP